MRLIVSAFLLACAMPATAATIDFAEYSGLTERVWSDSIVSGGVEFSNTSTWIYSGNELSCMSITSSGIQLFCGNTEVSMVGAGTITFQSVTHSGSGPTTYIGPSNYSTPGLHASAAPTTSNGLDGGFDCGQYEVCSGPVIGPVETMIFYQKAGYELLDPGGNPFSSDPGMTNFELMVDFMPIDSLNIHSINMELTPAAVPIPAAVWLFGSALAGLGWMRRKQTV